jgi:hypothetical protein
MRQRGQVEIDGEGHEGVQRREKYDELFTPECEYVFIRHGQVLLTYIGVIINNHLLFP